MKGTQELGGVIEADYQGEIKIFLSTRMETVTLKRGEDIGQLNGEKIEL